MSEEYREFLCNALIIKALMQFLPFQDRKKAQEWLTKLQDIEDGTSEAKSRNEYAFYLLTNLQKSTLSPPFNKSPDPGKLKPLCKILPDFLYEEIMKQLKTSYCRLNKMLNSNEASDEVPELASTPEGFLTEHPRPRKGISAVCAVFSSYDDDPKKSN